MRVEVMAMQVRVMVMQARVIAMQVRVMTMQVRVMNESSSIFMAYILVWQYDQWLGLGYMSIRWHVSSCGNMVDD